MIVGGSISVPGDKSITHRALILAALSPTTSRLRGALTSHDARSTARVLRQLGALIGPLREGAEVSVRGMTRLRRPGSALHCGNSGTTARLMTGVLAAHPFRSVVTGDVSLRKRPMRRVTEPLELMGAQFEGPDPDRLPLAIQGGASKAIEWRLPVSSAQLKGAILLAAAVAGVEAAVLEPAGLSRDHTERMLRSLGFTVANSDGWIRFLPSGEFAPLDLEIPGDPSSAAFLVGAALLAESGNLHIRGVGVNPTRTGFIGVMRRMGAMIESTPQGDRSGEPTADLLVSPSELVATEVEPGEIPGLIDEIPMLAVLASRARGTTIFKEVGELRVKESDRLSLLADNLRAIGGKAAVHGNNLVVEGVGLAPKGLITTAGDHRIAMAFGVLARVPGAEVRIDNMACASVSFPGFWETLDRIERKPQ